MSTTTTTMLASIRLKGSFPASDTYFSNANLLSVLSDEMLKEVIPVIQLVNEEYFLTYKDHTITANIDKYRIPARAVASQLRDIQLIDASGNVKGLNRLFEEDRTSLTQSPEGYFLKGNQIILSPMPTQTTGQLRMSFIRRPSKFVLTSACAEITSIDTGNNQITVASLPSGYTTNTLIDFVQASSPYDQLDIDVAITGVSGTTITFADLPDDLAEGDYICLSGETCVPGVPEDLVPLLVQAALVACLSAKKDKSVEFEAQKLNQIKDTLVNLLQPRVKSNDSKVKATSLLNYFKN